MPVISDSFGDSNCIAFDLMSVNLADLPALPRLVPALKVCKIAPTVRPAGSIPVTCIGNPMPRQIVNMACHWTALLNML